MSFILTFLFRVGRLKLLQLDRLDDYLRGEFRRVGLSKTAELSAVLNRHACNRLGPITSPLVCTCGSSLDP